MASIVLTAIREIQEENNHHELLRREENHINLLSKIPDENSINTNTNNNEPNSKKRNTNVAEKCARMITRSQSRSSSIDNYTVPTTVGGSESADMKCISSREPIASKSTSANKKNFVVVRGNTHPKLDSKKSRDRLFATEKGPAMRKRSSSINQVYPKIEVRRSERIRKLISKLN